mmetsp:Transcript_9740/g.23853  ORF Transcript_9740/g.23853 Transcript_9740/m.23853 type:complete len:261 (-) Transcript_9740:239-1021(-)
MELSPPRVIPEAAQILRLTLRSARLHIHARPRRIPRPRRRARIGVDPPRDSNAPRGVCREAAPGEEGDAEDAEGIVGREFRDGGAGFGADDAVGIVGEELCRGVDPARGAAAPRAVGHENIPVGVHEDLSRGDALCREWRERRDERLEHRAPVGAQGGGPREDRARVAQRGLPAVQAVGVALLRRVAAHPRVAHRQRLAYARLRDPASIDRQVAVLPINPRARDVEWHHAARRLLRGSRRLAKRRVPRIHPIAQQNHHET